MTRRSVIVGNGIEDTGKHTCLADRALNGFFTPLVEEEMLPIEAIPCRASCISSLNAVNDGFDAGESLDMTFLDDSDSEVSDQSIQFILIFLTTGVSCSLVRSQEGQSQVHRTPSQHFPVTHLLQVLKGHQFSEDVHRSAKNQ